MSSEEQSQSSWSDYYKAVSGRKPRDLLAETVARFGTAGKHSGFAIDLGCGAGIETIELLNRGWRVLAIDNQPEAIAYILVNSRPKCTTHVRLDVYQLASVAAV